LHGNPFGRKKKCDSITLIKEYTPDFMDIHRKKLRFFLGYDTIMNRYSLTAIATTGGNQ
jgi:hypothetical protein